MGAIVGFFGGSMEGMGNQIEVSLFFYNNSNLATEMVLAGILQPRSWWLI
jgi:hypothetical protein